MIDVACLLLLGTLLYSIGIIYLPSTLTTCLLFTTTHKHPLLHLLLLLSERTGRDHISDRISLCVNTLITIFQDLRFNSNGHLLLYTVLAVFYLPMLLLLLRFVVPSIDDRFASLLLLNRRVTFQAFACNHQLIQVYTDGAFKVRDL